MLTIKIALATALFSLPLAAHAAELPHAKIHKHVHHWHAHIGYYWYEWGSRSGGSRHSWYGSTFKFAGPWLW
jgi:hypothetical protein